MASPDAAEQPAQPPVTELRTDSSVKSEAPTDHLAAARGPLSSSVQFSPPGSAQASPSDSTAMPAAASLSAAPTVAAGTPAAGEAARKAAAAPRPSGPGQTGSPAPQASAGPIFDLTTHCSRCLREGDAAVSAQCSRCRKLYHLACARPPLAAAPAGEWACGSCHQEWSNTKASAAPAAKMANGTPATPASAAAPVPAAFGPIGTCNGTSLQPPLAAPPVVPPLSPASAARITGSLLDLQRGAAAALPVGSPLGLPPRLPENALAALAAGRNGKLPSPPSSISSPLPPQRKKNNPRKEWSQELKKLFETCFRELKRQGVKQTPKTILDLMQRKGLPASEANSIPLTMRHVQSHFQKYVEKHPNSDDDDDPSAPSPHPTPAPGTPVLKPPPPILTQAQSLDPTLVALGQRVAAAAAYRDLYQNHTSGGEIPTLARMAIPNGRTSLTPPHPRTSAAAAAAAPAPQEAAQSPAVSRHARSDDELHQLRRRLAELESEKAAIEKARAALAGDVTRLQKENASLTKEKNGLTKEVASLSKENAALAKENAGLSRESATMTKREAAMSKETAALAKDKAALQQRVDALREELRKARLPPELPPDLQQAFEAPGGVTRERLNEGLRAFSEAERKREQQVWELKVQRLTEKCEKLQKSSDTYELAWEQEQQATKTLRDQLQKAAELERQLVQLRRQMGEKRPPPPASTDDREEAPEDEEEDAKPKPTKRTKR